MLRGLGGSSARLSEREQKPCLHGLCRNASFAPYRVGARSVSRRCMLRIASVHAPYRAISFLRPLQRHKLLRRYRDSPSAIYDKQTPIGLTL